MADKRRGRIPAAALPSVELRETNEFDEGDLVSTGVFEALVCGPDVASPGALAIDPMLRWARKHFEFITIAVGWDRYSAGSKPAPDAFSEWPAEGMLVRRRYHYEPLGERVYRTFWVELMFDEPDSIPSMIAALASDPCVVEVAESPTKPDFVDCLVRPADGQSSTTTIVDAVARARPPLDYAAIAAVLALEGGTFTTSTGNGIAFFEGGPGPE